MKSKSTAAVLAFLFGGLGVHKFYLGQGGLGLLYLLFCWTYIPLIVAFIEFVLLLAMDEKTFNLKYNAAYMDVWDAPHQVTAASSNTNTQAQNITINLPQQVMTGEVAQAGQQIHVPAVQAHQPQVDVIGKLSQLNELRLQGVLTDDEFEVQKQRLLAAP